MVWPQKMADGGQPVLGADPQGFAGYAPAANQAVSDPSELAKNWWGAQYQQGGNDNMWLDWGKLKPEDQQYLTNYFQNNRLDPAKALNTPIAANPGDSSTAQLLAAKSNPFVSIDGEGNVSQLSDSQLAQGALRGLGNFKIANDLYMNGTSNNAYNSASPQDMTQIDELYRISPDIAAKYGITAQSAADSTRQNMQAQAQRNATHDKAFAQEAGLVQAIIGGMAGGAFSGLGASGTEAATTMSSGLTDNALVNSMIQNGLRGAVTSGLSGGDPLKGGLTGALTGGLGQYTNGLTDMPWLNHAVQGIGSNAISSMVNGRPITGRGLLTSGLTSVAGGLTNSNLANQGIGGLTSYLLNKNNGQTATQNFIGGANQVAAGQSSLQQRVALARAAAARAQQPQG